MTHAKLDLEELIKEGKARRVPRFPDYIITNDDRVFSLKKGRVHEMKQRLYRGYTTVGISNPKSGRSKTIGVHRLERHGSAKLTGEQAEYIRKNYVRRSHSRSNRAELSKMFGVSKTTINDVVSGKLWSAK